MFLIGLRKQSYIKGDGATASKLQCDLIALHILDFTLDASALGIGKSAGVEGDAGERDEKNERKAFHDWVKAAKCVRNHNG